MDESRCNAIESNLWEVFAENTRIRELEKKKYKESLQQVLDIILTNMQCDEVFKCLYNTTESAESSYENFRISKPNEFAVNISFVWPGSACQVVYDAEQPGYVKLKINLNDPVLQRKRNELPSLEMKLSKWIDKNGFFLRHHFKSWMQGIIDKTLLSIKIPDTEIKRSVSGPGFTLKFFQQLEQFEYSVDLVPTFLLSHSDWPNLPVRQLHKEVNCKEWMVVPKEPRSESESVYWSMSFYEQERELIDNRPLMKTTLELIKLLRDQQLWSNELYSYTIKTVFLWECHKTSIDTRQNGLVNIFIKMLQKLSDYLLDGHIKYYWDPKLNLIDKMKDDTKRIIRDRISTIIKYIHFSTDEPHQIKTYFGYKPERTQQGQNEESNVSLISLLEVDNDETNVQSSLTTHFNVLSYSKSETYQEIEKCTRDVQDNPEVDVDCSKGCKIKNASDIDNSTLTVELCKQILNEQQDTKRVLLKMSEQIKTTSEEIVLLRKDNDALKELLRKNNMEFTSNPLLENNALNSKDGISRSSIDQHYSSSPPKQHILNALNSSASNSLLTGVTDSKDSMFSDLLSYHTMPNSSSNSSSYEKPSLLD